MLCLSKDDAKPRHPPAGILGAFVKTPSDFLSYGQVIVMSSLYQCCIEVRNQSS